MFDLFTIAPLHGVVDGVVPLGAAGKGKSGQQHVCYPLLSALIVPYTSNIEAYVAGAEIGFPRRTIIPAFRCALPALSELVLLEFGGPHRVCVCLWVVAASFALVWLGIRLHDWTFSNRNLSKVEYVGGLAYESVRRDRTGRTGEETGSFWYEMARQTKKNSQFYGFCYCFGSPVS